jgi:putative FmdB family regulatory protein
MPTYGYRCPACGHEYEKFQKISDRNRAKCPECGTRGERQISGGAGLVFKGSGFYITDYKRAGDQKGDKPAAEKGEPTSPSIKSDKSDAGTSPEKPSKKPTGADT